MANDLFKRAEIYTKMAQNGKLNIKGSGMTASSVYKFIYNWQKIGLVEVIKQGRELNVVLTPKGLEYLEIVKNLSLIKDF